MFADALAQIGIESQMTEHYELEKETLPPSS